MNFLPLYPTTNNQNLQALTDQHKYLLSCVFAAQTWLIMLYTKEQIIEKLLMFPIIISAQTLFQLSCFNSRQFSLHFTSIMKCVLFLFFPFMYRVNTNSIEGLEFEDNGATTHITEENGIASISFWVGYSFLLCAYFNA